MSDWRADPASMANHLTMGDYHLWPYVKLLSQKFVDAVRGDDPRQIWNLPSRFGSTSLLLWGARWALECDPTLHILYLTYDSELAWRVTAGVLTTAYDNGDEQLVQLRREVHFRGRWLTDKEHGGITAIGVQSSCLYPVDVILVDNLLSRYQDANYQVARDAAWLLYSKMHRSRLLGHPGAIIMAETRRHEDDMTGRLLKAEPDVTPWALVKLPAIAESDDLLGRRPGEYLGGGIFSEQDLDNRRRVLGHALWAAREQQRPLSTNA